MTAGDNTFIWKHQPVLAREITSLIAHGGALKNGVFADGTLGLGGHAKALLSLLGGESLVLGFDKDENALKMARQNVNDARLKTFHKSYLEIPSVLRREGLAGVDGALFDLGLSSYQLDDAARGFSFLRDGPLDMRFDGGARQSAKDIVNKESVEKLEEIFRDYGGEYKARQIAFAIFEARRESEIRTTLQLAHIIESVSPRFGKIHPATKVFQALRIAVNGELDCVRGLPQVISQILLKSGARAAVLTFHSDEDRIIKQGFKALAQSGVFALVNKKVIEPSYEEVKANPRARSAKLRLIERVK